MTASENTFTLQHLPKKIYENENDLGCSQSPFVRLRWRVLQGVLRKLDAAARLMDARQEVLDPFFRSRSCKGPSSRRGQHFCALVVVRHPEVECSALCTPAMGPE